LSVAAISPQRIALAVDAPAGTVQAVFGVSLRDFADADGRTFHAPLAQATVPPELDGLVTAIAGLDARPTEHPALTFPNAAGTQPGRATEVTR
jgi:hypothetical protein